MSLSRSFLPRRPKRCDRRMGNLESGCNSEGARVGAISWSSGNRFGHTMRQLGVNWFCVIVGNRRVLRKECLRGIFGVCVSVFLRVKRKVIERTFTHTEF